MMRTLKNVHKLVFVEKIQTNTAYGHEQKESHRKTTGESELDRKKDKYTFGEIVIHT